MNRGAAAILMVISAALAGSTGICIRTLNEKGFTLGQITFILLLITTAIMFVAVLIYDRKLFRIKKEHILLFLLLGIFKGLMDYTFIVSLNTNTLSYATVLQMTSPLFLMVISAILLRKWMPLNLVLSVIVFIVGAVLVSGIEPFEEIGITWGTLVGLASGAMLAAVIITSKFIVDKGYSPITGVFYAFLIGTLVLIPFTNFDGCVEHITAGNNIFLLIIFSIICTFLPFALDGVGIKYLKPMTASIIMTLEVVFSSIAGICLFKEDLTLLNVLGIALVIASVTVIVKTQETKMEESRARLIEMGERAKEKRRMNRN